MAARPLPRLGAVLLNQLVEFATIVSETYDLGLKGDRVRLLHLDYLENIRGSWISLWPVLKSGSRRSNNTARDQRSVRYFLVSWRYLTPMARPLRLEFTGDLYHVASRDDHRESIHLDDGDRHHPQQVASGRCLISTSFEC